LNIDVPYDILASKLKKINELVVNSFKNVKNVEFSRSHFKQFGDFSLMFEVVYYVLSSGYVEYMDVQQEINFGIRDAFEKEKIDMAFPTQTLYIKK